MNKIILFLFSSLFIGILFLIFIVTLLNPNEKTIEVSSFPAFEMNELNEEPINQNSFQEGEYKLINVWATWCVNCKLEHGFLMSLQNKGIKIFGLNYKDDKEKALRWLNQFGNPYWKTIYDPRGNFGLEIGVSGAPETYLIDKRNKIIQKHIGILDDKVWVNKFTNLMK